MKKASVRDLHINTSALIEEAASGAIIVIERRGKPVAELRPLSKADSRPPFRDMTRFWNEFPQLPGDSTRFIEEDRER